MPIRPDCLNYCEFLDGDATTFSQNLPRYFPITPVLIVEGENDIEYPELKRDPVYARTFQSIYHHAFGHKLPGIMPEESGEGLTGNERMFLEACCIHRILSAAPFATDSIEIGVIKSVERKVDDLWLRKNGTVERHPLKPKYSSVNRSRRTRMRNKISGVNETSIDLNADYTLLPSVYDLQYQSEVFVHQQWGTRDLTLGVGFPYETLYMSGLDLKRTFPLGTFGQRVFISHRELIIDDVKVIFPKIEHVVLMNSSKAIDDYFSIEIARLLLARISETRNKSKRVKEAKYQYYQRKRAA